MAAEQIRSDRRTEKRFGPRRTILTAAQGLRFFSESPTRKRILLFQSHATSEMRGCLRFLDAYAKAPAQITLDLDATDDPLHGQQEGRFFHGYYDCHCYLPLYIFCGRHLLAAKLRRSNIDGAAGAVEEVARIVRQIRARWPRVRPGPQRASALGAPFCCAPTAASAART
jgi:hypothetical protein